MGIRMGQRLSEPDQVLSFLSRPDPTLKKYNKTPPQSKRGGLNCHPYQPSSFSLVVQYYEVIRTPSNLQEKHVNRFVGGWCPIHFVWSRPKDWNCTNEQKQKQLTITSWYGDPIYLFINSFIFKLILATQIKTCMHHAHCTVRHYHKLTKLQNEINGHCLIYPKLRFVHLYWLLL